MKHLKQKLMAAASMVMVAFVMLTSASYAWFTISTTPEVKTIKATATTNENFEIALGTDKETDPDEYVASLDAEEYDATNTTGNNHHWGQYVDFTNISLTGLGPATLNGNAIKSTVYGPDGRPAGLDGLDEVGDMEEGYIALKDKEDNVVGQKILFWLRSNKKGNVTAEVTGATFNSVAGKKVEVAVEYNGQIKELDVGDGTNAAGAAVAKEIGTIAESGTEYAVNVAIPVYVYIYLEGANVTNADVATAVDVVVGNITFKNLGLTTDNNGAYTMDYNNDPSIPVVTQNP